MQIHQAIVGWASGYINNELRRVIKQERTNPKYRGDWNVAHILRFECRDHFKDFNSNACMFFERIKQHYFKPTPYTVRDIMTQLNRLSWNGNDDPTLFVAKYLTLQHDGELLTETSSGARAFPEYSEYSKCRTDNSTLYY